MTIYLHDELRRLMYRLINTDPTTMDYTRVAQNLEVILGGLGEMLDEAALEVFPEIEKAERMNNLIAQGVGVCAEEETPPLFQEETMPTGPAEVMTGTLQYKEGEPPFRVEQETAGAGGEVLPAGDDGSGEAGAGSPAVDVGSVPGTAPAEVPVQKYTIGQVRTAISAAKKSGTITSIPKWLEEHGYDNASTIPEADFSKVMELLGVTHA